MTPSRSEQLGYVRRDVRYEWDRLTDAASRIGQFVLRGGPPLRLIDSARRALRRPCNKAQSPVLVPISHRRSNQRIGVAVEKQSGNL